MNHKHIESAIINESLEMVPVSRLTVHPKNPRRGNVALIQESIQQHGFYLGILVQTSTGHIVVGNHRYLAAVAAGMTEVPVQWIDCSNEQAERILAVDNRSADVGTYDDRMLAALLTELQRSHIGLLGTGYNSDDLDAILKEIGETEAPVIADPGAELDKADELLAKWRVERGQLWQIGEHFALCGDSTNAADVRRLVNGRRASLCATDPPYLVDYDGTNHPSSWEYKKKVARGEKKDKNKDWSDSYGKTWDDSSQGEALFDGYVKVALLEAVKKDAAWYVWHAARNAAMLERVWNRHGLFAHQQIIWNKTAPVLNYSWYMAKHEPCFFGWLRGHEPPRCAEDYPTTVWDFSNRGAGHDDVEHPTVKPVGVFTIPMLQHTTPGGLCYEPFAGSFTQVVAAEQLGRVCYAIEIEPKYVAVGLERLAGMGLEPKLVNG